MIKAKLGKSCNPWFKNENLLEYGRKFNHISVRTYIYDGEMGRMKAKMSDDNTIKNILFFIISKQIDFMFPWVYAVIDHRRRQNVVKT